MKNKEVAEEQSYFGQFQKQKQRKRSSQRSNFANPTISIEAVKDTSSEKKTSRQ
jgi:hypothetical protein